MSFEIKTWVARVGTGLNKFYNSKTNDTLILTNTPDSVTTKGDSFTADNMNNLEQRIKTETDYAEGLANTAAGLANTAAGLATSALANAATAQTRADNAYNLAETKESVANKGIANGYCPLDSGGKVALQNLPATLLKYQGVWDASTNTPTLTNPDTSKIGYVYNVSVAGTQFGINFSLGDWLIYNANGVPEKSDNSDDVASVNGRTGAVTGLAEDSYVVHNTGNETIAGNKAFTGIISAANLSSSTITNITDTVIVGGRNYVLTSGGYTTTSKDKWVSSPSGNWSKTMYNGYVRFTKLTTAAGSWMTTPLSVPTEFNTKYTLTVRVRTSLDKSVLRVLLSTGAYSSGTFYDSITSTTANTWKTISFFFTNITTSVAYVGFTSTDFTAQVGEYLDVEFVKLEKGNKAGDWSPAPEDKANDSAVVHNTGNETVGGDKAFTGGISAGKGFFATGFSSDSLPADTEGIATYRNTSLGVNRIASFIKSALGVLTYTGLAVGAYVNSKFSALFNSDGTVNFNFRTTAPTIPRLTYQTTLSAATNSITITNRNQNGETGAINAKAVKILIDMAAISGEATGTINAVYMTLNGDTTSTYDWVTTVNDTKMAIGNYRNTRSSIICDVILNGANVHVNSFLTVKDTVPSGNGLAFQGHKTALTSGAINSITLTTGGANGFQVGTAISVIETEIL